MLTFFGSWPGYGTTPFETRYRLIKQAGFDATSVWWEEEDPEQGDYLKQPEMARAAGLWVEYMHAGYGQACHFWEDTLAGESMYNYFMMCLGDCAAFDIPTMVMHVGCGGDPMPLQSQAGLDRFARMIDKAELLGVNIAIENQGDPAKVVFAMEILERFDAPCLGMCYDSGHASQFKNLGRGTEMLERFGHRLKALHLHDNDGTGDKHWPPYAQTGIIDWPALMKKIERKGYRGPTALELGGGHDGLTPEEYLALAFDRAKQLEALRNA